jgi:NAD(P)-dependent dehydrogenase (short-subunit alcohol dehydrogenase family)
MAATFKKLFDLTGKVALVTGGGTGLGRSICEGYAQFGAAVAVVDIDKSLADETCRAIRDAGGKAVAIRCDVTKIADVKSAVLACAEELGLIDILVNNAGTLKRAPAEEMTDEAWDLIINVNLKGPFLFCREVGKDMIRRGKGGRIINIASIAALVGLETGNVNYSASKGGIIAMTRCLAIEWAKHKILVNAIAPTHMRTPFLERVLKDKPENLQYFLNNIPLGRLGEPADIVGPAIFLASDAAALVTGHTLVVDGGHTAR